MKAHKERAVALGGTEKRKSGKTPARQRRCRCRCLRSRLPASQPVSRQTIPLA